MHAHTHRHAQAHAHLRHALTIKNSAKKGARTTRVNTTLVSVTHSMPRTFMASDTSTAPYY